MDFRLSEEEERLREGVRAFLKEELTEEVVEETRVGLGFGPASWEFLRKLGARRWVASSFPVEYGGLGASYVERFIIEEELDYHGAPTALVGASMAGPTILLYGNEEQKREYLPRIARGEIEFALGYTEPHAGSDLAALEIRAEEDGDDYVMNGQKIFNTATHYAQYHWLGARTDPKAFPKHKGISLFIVDLSSPGITVAPLWTISGGRTNQVFYDNVRVPKRNLVGEKNRGFYHIATALDFERMYPVGAVQRLLEEIVVYAKEARGLDLNPLVRHRLAELAVEVEVARLLAFRIAWLLDRGTIPNYEAAMVKVFVTELSGRVTNTGLAIMGLYGQLGEGSKLAPLGGRMVRRHLGSVRERIVRGTSEVMRNIIAMRGLGLPREPRG